MLVRFAIASAAVAATAAACDSIQPGSSSVERSVPARPPADGDDASATADSASRYADGFSPGEINLRACDGCRCSRATSYCFGGPGTERVPSADGGGVEPVNDAADVDAEVDAGPVLCPVAANASGAPSLGCNALPAACAAKPTCACVVQALQPGFSCYLVCDETNGFLIYCPTP
jgi:hypothetical protein